MVKFQTLLGKVRRKRGTGRRRGVTSAFTFLGSKSRVPESVAKIASPQNESSGSFMLVNDSMLSELSHSMEFASDDDAENQLSANKVESESREAIDKLQTSQIDARDDGLITRLLLSGNEKGESPLDMAKIRRLTLEDGEESRDCSISSDDARNILAYHEGESIICYVDQQDLNDIESLPESSVENSTGNRKGKCTENQHQEKQLVDGGLVVPPPCAEKKVAEMPMGKVFESSQREQNLHECFIVCDQASQLSCCERRREGAVETVDPSSQAGQDTMTTDTKEKVHQGSLAHSLDNDGSEYIAGGSHKMTLQESGENDVQTEKSSTIFCPDDDGFESLLDSVHSQESSLLFEGDSLALTEEDHELSQNLPDFLLSTDIPDEDVINDSILSIQDKKDTIISSVSIERKVAYFEEIPRKKDSCQSPVVQPTKAISTRSGAFEKLLSTFEQSRQSKTTESMTHNSERLHRSVRYKSARTTSRTMLEPLPAKCESERVERSFQYSSTDKTQLIESIAGPEKIVQTTTVFEGQVEPSLQNPLKTPAIKQLPKEPLTGISVVKSQTSDFLETSSLGSCTDAKPLASSTAGPEKMLKSTTVVEYQEDQSVKNPLETIAIVQRPERPLANGDLDSVPSDEYNIRKTSDNLEDRCDIPFDEISEEPHTETICLANQTDDQDDYTDILLTGSEFEVSDINIGSLFNLQTGISSCSQGKNGSEQNGSKTIVKFEKRDHDYEPDEPASKTEGNSQWQPKSRSTTMREDGQIPESLAMKSMKRLIDFSKSITQSEEQHQEATDSKHDERRAWAQTFVKNISGMRGDCSCDALTDVDERLFSFFPWKKVDEGSTVPS